MIPGKPQSLSQRLFIWPGSFAAVLAKFPSSLKSGTNFSFFFFCPLSAGPYGISFRGNTPWNKEGRPVNSLAPGGFENIFQNVFFKLISWIDTLSNSCETALRSMPQYPSDDKSTLVQVMAWCRQAASHYLSQCCPRSLSPYGVTRPQWVNTLRLRKNGHHFSGDIFKCILLNENVWIFINITVMS